MKPLPWFMRLVVRFFQSRLAHVAGAEDLPRGSFLLAANHIDFLDAFAIDSAVIGSGRSAPMVLTQTTNYTWTGLSLPIDPNNRAATLEAATRVLTSGGVLLNFPEGQRTLDGTLQPGKTGTVRLALAAGVPIVPVAILGPRRSRLFVQSVWQYFTRGRFVKIQFGAPFRPPSVREPSREDLERLTNELMGKIRDLSEQAVRA